MQLPRRLGSATVRSVAVTLLIVLSVLAVVSIGEGFKFIASNKEADNGLGKRDGSNLTFSFPASLLGTAPTTSTDVVANLLNGAPIDAPSTSSVNSTATIGRILGSQLAGNGSVIPQTSFLPVSSTLAHSVCLPSTVTLSVGCLLQPTSPQVTATETWFSIQYAYATTSISFVAVTITSTAYLARGETVPLPSVEAPITGGISFPQGSACEILPSMNSTKSAALTSSLSVGSTSSAISTPSIEIVPSAIGQVLPLPLTSSLVSAQISNPASNVVQNVSSAVSGLLNTAQGDLSNVVNRVTGAAASLASTVRNDVTKLVGDLSTSTGAANVVADVSSLITDLSYGVNNVVGNVEAGSVSAISSLEGAAGNVVNSAASVASESLGNALGGSTAESYSSANAESIVNVVATVNGVNMVLPVVVGSSAKGGVLGGLGLKRDEKISDGI